MTADLIVRLESAAEGSRELSDEVLRALGWAFVDTGDARSDHWADPAGRAYDCWDDPHARSRSPIPMRPDPARSFDDALGLVPEGWFWTAANHHDGRTSVPDGERAWALLRSASRTVTGAAATPALALCAAILRANLHPADA